MFWPLVSPVKVLVSQSCLTLCNPIDYSPPWNPWKEYWSMLSGPPPGYHPDLGITPTSPFADRFFTTWATSPEIYIQMWANICDLHWLPNSALFGEISFTPLFSSLLKGKNPFILALTVTCSLHSGFAKLHREQSPSGSHLGLGASLGMQPWPQVGRQKEEMPVFLAAPSWHTSLGLPTSGSVFMSKNIPLICWSHSDQVSDYQPSNAV